ncbi:thiaminase II [Litorivicinus sp.]|nr:thiaminase II [Litorivicinus sp.]
MLVDHLLKQNRDVWTQYVCHDFVSQLDSGKLCEPAFQYYLIQDYQFLIHFARSYALAASKAESLVDLKHASQSMNTILNTEIKLHLDYCSKWGLTGVKVVNSALDPACKAYIDFIFSTGALGGLIETYVAMAPCMLGYAQIGEKLKKSAQNQSPYQSWIEMYSSEEFQAAAKAEVRYLNRLADEENISEIRLQNLTSIFNEACRLESSFWQMALDNGRG